VQRLVAGCGHFNLVARSFEQCRKSCSYQVIVFDHKYPAKLSRLQSLRLDRVVMFGENPGR
jgi:hypothetical protein